MTIEINQLEFRKKLFIIKNETATKHISEKLLDLVIMFESNKFRVEDFNQGGFDNDYVPKFNDNDVMQNHELRIQRSKSFYPYIVFDPVRSSNKDILRFMELLEEFYENRDTEFQHYLILESSHPRYIKIKPQSGDVACLINDQKEKERLYNIYLKEFEDLTSFLKNIIENKGENYE
jgi:hypothetical protein